jgi:hypothetical protein
MSWSGHGNENKNIYFVGYEPQRSRPQPVILLNGDSDTLRLLNCKWKLLVSYNNDTCHRSDPGSALSLMKEDCQANQRIQLTVFITDSVHLATDKTGTLGR